jgi:hypothetical protein
VSLILGSISISVLLYVDIVIVVVCSRPQKQNNSRDLMNRTFLCPAPLVYAYDDSETVLWAFRDGNCASPCPTITYTKEEWTFLTTCVFYLALASIVSTSTALIILISEFSKLFLRAMFVLGFLVSATISLAFFAGNSDNSLVCNGEAHFVQKGTFCMFHASVVVFLFLWVEIWSVLLSIDTYMHIVSRTSADHITYWRKRYLTIAFTFCTFMTLIPLCAGNLGFDPYANLPFCLYLFSDNESYFWWTLFAPFCILNAFCLILTIAGAVRIHQIFVSTSKYTSSSACSSGAAVTVPVDSDMSAVNVLSDSLKRQVRERDSTYEYEEDGSEHVDDDSYSEGSNRMVSQDSASTLSLAQGGGFLSLNPNLYGGTLSYNEPLVLPQVQSTQNPLSPTTSSSERIVSSRLDRNRGHDDVPWRDSESWGNEIPSPTLRVGSGGTDNSSKVSAVRFINRDSFPNEISSSGSTRPSELSGSEGRKTWISSVGKKIKKGKINLNLLKESLRYNGRSILFVIVFCVTTMYVAPSLYYINSVKYDAYVQGSVDYVECLVYSSFICEIQTQKGVDACAMARCGAFPGDKVGLRASKTQVCEKHSDLKEIMFLISYSFHIVFQYDGMGFWLWDYSVIYLWLFLNITPKIF